MDCHLRIGACLSLSGRFAQFGRQAALGLQAWRSLDGTADLLIEDDRSDRRMLEAILPGVAARCDILLGPYSTLLMRAAGRLAADPAGSSGITAAPVTMLSGPIRAMSSRC